jgi:hypothetical protein
MPTYKKEELKSLKMITDPSLYPYKIVMDDSNYVLVKEITPESGKVYDTFLGHYSSLDFLLTKLMDFEIRSNNFDSFLELKAFILEFKEKMYKLFEI